MQRVHLSQASDLCPGLDFVDIWGLEGQGFESRSLVLVLRVGVQGLGLRGTLADAWFLSPISLSTCVCRVRGLRVDG